jgi:N,N-dimethylformamidase beta subunit-like, C-terminal/Concanavalin A-like lectin/glucanases superfamily
MTAPQPLAPMSLPGTYAYAEKTVRAGESLHFRISSDTAYRLSIVRLGWDTTTTLQDTVIDAFPVDAAAQQPIRPGSYVHVSQALPASALSQLTLECWVRSPATVAGWQGLISQHTHPTDCGFGLFLDDARRPSAYFGDGGAFQGAWLGRSNVPIDDAWHHLAAVFNQSTVTLWVDGVQQASFTGPTAVNPGAAPLRLAAYGSAGQTSNTLDGDLAMPAIYDRALSAAEIQLRAATRPPTVPASNLLACWPLTEESGSVVNDVSANGRHGQIINGATWMIGGPGFDAAAVTRFGTYNPSADTTRGHGLRFSSEDLYDCNWTISETYVLSPDLVPGIYVGRIEYPSPGFNHRYDTTFVVRPAATKPKAPVLVLCNTNTWLAYNVPFPNAPDAVDGWGAGGHSLTVPGAPGFNLYEDCRRQKDPERPTFQIGVNTPWSAFPYMTPGITLLPDAALYPGYGHLMRAERPLHVWLEQTGYDFDVAGDLDLHAEPTLLAGYQIVVINGHSEYWSAEAYVALENYLNSGGRLMVLSGNTMFWRVSFDSQRQVMECRKLPSSVGGRTDSPGEIYHSQDGARGGLMRECPHPTASGQTLAAWRLTGVESVGYGQDPGTYAVQAPSHVFFQSPEVVGVVANQLFASGAVYHEYDVQLSTIPGDPAGKPAGLPGAAPTVLAQAPATKTGGLALNYFDYRAQTQPIGASSVASEIIDWQRGPGGRVFATAAIAIGDKLRTDSQLAALIRNVMSQFGVAHQLEFLALSFDGKVLSKRWNGTAWLPLADGSGWEDLGGDLISPPTAVRWAPGQFSLFGLNTAGQLQQKRWDGVQWQPTKSWDGLGGTLQGRPAAVSWGRDRLHLFARGADDRIYMKYWDGRTWAPVSGWQDMGGAMLDSPATAWWSGKLSVCAIGSDGTLKYRELKGSKWDPINDWYDMGGSNLRGTPVITAWDGNRVSLFAADASGNLFTKDWDGTKWLPSFTGWTPLGGEIRGTPAVVVRGGRKLSIFATGTDGHMLAKWRDGAAAPWEPSRTGWSDLGGSFAGSPTAVAWRGEHVSVAGIGSDGRLRYTSWHGTTGSPIGTSWLDLSGALAGRLAMSPQALAWIGRA